MVLKYARSSLFFGLPTIPPMIRVGVSTSGGHTILVDHGVGRTLLVVLGGLGIGDAGVRRVPRAGPLRR